MRLYPWGRLRAVGGRSTTPNADNPATAESQVAALIDYTAAGQRPGPSLLRLLITPQSMYSVIKVTESCQALGRTKGTAGKHDNEP